MVGLPSKKCPLTIRSRVPSSALAVDECMCQFTGRAKEKLTIANKLIPTGIKAWIIADKDFFYHWFWHAKGNGP